MTMLVVRRSFLAYDRYAGEVRLIAGQSFVDSSHEIAQAHPECFKPAPSRGRGSRERITCAGGTASIATPKLPVRPRGREAWRLYDAAPTCSIRGQPSGIRSRLATNARVKLLTILRSTTERDGLEVGALLFGAEHRQLVEIVAVVGPGPAAERHRDRFRFDMDHARHVISEMRSAGLSLIGDAHSHPGDRVDPSPTDLTAFSSLRSALGLRRYLAIIAIRTTGGWTLQPWIVSAGFGRDRCEPAAIMT